MGAGVGYYSGLRSNEPPFNEDARERVLGEDGIYRTRYKPNLLTSRVNADPIEQQTDELRERTIHELREENTQLRATLEKLRAL